jgi:hypothetical protein
MCDSSATIYQPQQSVLKPQAGQRQTACIRYIASPHRSQSTLSAFWLGAESLRGEEGWMAGVGAMGSDMGKDYLRLEGVV